MSGQLGSFDPLGYFIHLPNFDPADLEPLAAIASSLDPDSDTFTEALDRIGKDPRQRAFSTVAHETVHFYQVAGTPFGQFWTHLLLAQSLAVEALLKPRSGLLSESEPPLALSLPLATNTHGLPGGREALDRVLEIWQYLSQAERNLIDQSQDDISAVLDTINQALLLTYSLGYWDERNLLVKGLAGEIPIVVSELPSRSRAYPEASGLTTRNILEGQARLLELRALGVAGAFELADRVMREGDSTNESTVLQVMGALHGMRFQYSEELINTVSVLIDLALLVPLDPNCGTLWGKYLRWEDIHPAHRYVRAAQATATLGLLERMDDYDGYLEELCKITGWLKPGDILPVTLAALDEGRSIYDRFGAALLRVRSAHPGIIATSAYEHFVLFPPPSIIDKSSMRLMEPKWHSKLHSEASVVLLSANYLKRELARQILMEREITPPDLILKLGWTLHVFLRIHMGVSIQTSESQEGGREFELAEVSFENEVAREIQRVQHEAEGTRSITFQENDVDGLACLQRGMKLWLRGSNVSAEEDFTNAIAHGFDIAVVYEVRAWARRRQGEFQRAEEDFTKAIDRGAKGARVHAGRGLVRGYQEKFAEAEQDFDKAIQLEPQQSEFYFFRAVVRSRLERHSMAEADFGSAISAGYDEIGVYRKRAIIRFHLNKLAEAEADLTSAIERGDTSAEVFLERAGVRLDQDKIAEAESDLTSAIERGESGAEIFLARGVARASLGRNREAEGDFTIAIELGRDDPEPLYRRGVARSFVGDQTGAEEDLTAAIQLGMKDAIVYQARGRVRSLRGAHREAEEDFTKALAANPKDASLYYDRGIARRDQGQRSAADADFREASALDAHQPE